MCRQQANDYFKMHRGARWNNFLTVSSCITAQWSLLKLTLLALIKAQTGCDTLKEVFQMISVSHCVVWKNWQHFKGFNIYMSLCVAAHVQRVTQLQPRRADTGRRLNFCLFYAVKNKEAFTFYDTYFQVNSLHFGGGFSFFLSRAETKWPVVLMCIFHHPFFFSSSLSLWWIWAVPLLRHCLRVAQWVWLIDGRQWLSPPESKHFCVVSPLKVLLSLLRGKTLFVYSHSDGTSWQLPLKRR